MIENGSCCALLAEEIARTKPSTTIITNSAFIASYIRRVEGARVVLLGGDFQNDAQVMVGPILRICLAQFHVNKLFVGADGYIPQIGFTASDHLRVQAVRDMAEHAKQVIVLTESSKFSKDSVVPLAIEKGVAAVVTDQQISPGMEEVLQQDGIQVYKAG